MSGYGVFFILLGICFCFVPYGWIVGVPLIIMSAIMGNMEHQADQRADKVIYVDPDTNDIYIIDGSDEEEVQEVLEEQKSIMFYAVLFGLIMFTIGGFWLWAMTG